MQLWGGMVISEPVVRILFQGEVAPNPAEALAEIRRSITGNVD